MITFFIKGRDNKVIVYREDLQQPIIATIEDITDNQAEWASLVKAMQYISGSEMCRASGAVICTDSVLLYKQVVGENRIKSKNIKPFYYEFNELKNELSGLSVAVKYIHDNKARDFL